MYVFWGHDRLQHCPQRWAHSGRMRRMIQGDGSSETVRIRRRFSGPYRPQVQGLWVPFRSCNEFNRIFKPSTLDTPLKRGKQIQHDPTEFSTETQRATTWEMNNLDSLAHEPVYWLCRLLSISNTSLLLWSAPFILVLCFFIFLLLLQFFSMAWFLLCFVLIFRVMTTNAFVWDLCTALHP